MPRLALILDRHPNVFNPADPVKRVVVGPFDRAGQIDDELTRTHFGRPPFSKVGIVEIPEGDPEGILADSVRPITVTAIFLVTTLEVGKPETAKEILQAGGKSMLVKFSRSPGFFPDLAQAKKCVEENRGDIFETCYNYALVEEIHYGLYPAVLSSHWYRWENDGYLPCEVPDWTKGTYGSFAIG